MIYDKLYILRIGIPDYCLVDIDDWNVDTAKAIIAKYDNVYGFRFQRRLWSEDRSLGRLDITAKIIKESGTYYIHAYTETLDDIKARIELNHEKVVGKDHTLVRQMERQGYTTIVKGINEKWSCFFNTETDVVLDEDLTKGVKNGKRCTKVQDQEE